MSGQAKQANPYTLADAGCYVDGARGIYVVDAVVKFAESHGFKPDECISAECDAHRRSIDANWSECEWASEIEDDADAYMNEHFPVKGAYWGRSEQGDWGLWTIDDEA